MSSSSGAKPSLIPIVDQRREGTAAAEELQALGEPFAWRALEQGGDRDPAREAQALELDHLLAQRDDEHDAHERAAGDGGEQDRREADVAEVQVRVGDRSG